MRTRARQARQTGFTLVELLVAVTIGMFVTLAVFTTLAASEGRKRTSTSVNNANQSGAYAAYTIDRAVRNAGSGFVQRWDDVGGCQINAKRLIGGSLTTLWPRAAALPAPFQAVPKALLLAPVVIFAGASSSGSDVLMVQAGSAGFGESPAVVRPASTSASGVGVSNTIGMRDMDLLLVAGAGNCMLEQAAASSGQNVTFNTSGTYYAAAGDTTSLATLTGVSSVYAFAIGNAVAFGATATNAAGATVTGNPPAFQLFGVGDNSTFFSFDLLRMDGTDAALPLTDGVLAMYALYGIDTDADGKVDTWVSPAASGWKSTDLLTGTPASNQKLRSIVALRVGMVMQAALIEKDKVAPTSLDLFTALPNGIADTLKQNVPITNQYLRHRTVEITVPLRNTLLRSAPAA